MDRMLKMANSQRGRMILRMAIPAAIVLLLIGVASFGVVLGDPDVTVNGKMTVAQRIGIGTTNPSVFFALDIVNKPVRLTNTADGSNLNMTAQGVSLSRPGTSYVDNRYLGSSTTFRTSNLAMFDTTALTIKSDGKLGIGTAAPTAELHVVGTTKTSVIQVLGNDVSERFDVLPVGSVQPAPGMVAVIDEANAGGLVLSSTPYDRRVAGIISGAGDLRPGVELSQEDADAKARRPVALNGRVYCFVDASTEPVRAGDLLTTSATPGHAMKVTDFQLAQGAVIGKAMTGLDSGKGLVLVLVSLQ